MRRIELVSLTLRNFRSFRAATTVEFIPQGGLKFLTGKNEVEPRLGANGAGKSTLWDALTWCLYGFSTRGLRAGDLTSWGEQKAEVIACFLIDGESARIERSSNPNRITIETKPSNQADIDALLGLDRARFAQAVLFGQKVRSFADLTVPERGALFDSMLDLTVWSGASDFASKRAKDLSKSIASLDQQLAFQDGQIASLQSSEALVESSNRWEVEQEKRLDAAIRAVEAAENTLLVAGSKVRKQKAVVQELPDIDASRRRLSELERRSGVLEGEYQRIFGQLSAAQDSQKFYAANKVCPTCSQTITAATRDSHASHLRTEIANLSADLKKNGLAARSTTTERDAMQGDFDKLLRVRSFQQELYTVAEQEEHAARRALDAAFAYAESIGNAENPYKGQLEASAEQLQRAQEARAGVVAETAKHRSELAQAEFWTGAFKRVKLFETNRILLQLQIEVNNAAILLGLHGWRILLKTEVETKSATIKSGIQVVIESPSASAPWEAWSGGEGQRLQLAITVGLASMIQRLAGVDFGFEVWDEPSAWLSPEGIDDLLACLQHRAATTGKAIWLCDHRGLVFSGFTEIWQARKTTEGSRIELLRD